MEDELLIARFNKLIGWKLGVDGSEEATENMPRELGELLHVADLLEKADFSDESTVKKGLKKKFMEMLDDGELDEDELYYAAGGLRERQDEEPDDINK